MFISSEVSLTTKVLADNHPPKEKKLKDIIQFAPSPLLCFASKYFFTKLVVDGVAVSSLNLIALQKQTLVTLVLSRPGRRRPQRQYVCRHVAERAKILRRSRCIR